MNKEDKMIEIMDKMAYSVDKLEKLQKECPKIEESKTFQDMREKTIQLTKHIRKQTVDMQADIQNQIKTAKESPVVVSLPINIRKDN